MVGSRIVDLLRARHTILRLGRNEGFDLSKPRPREWAAALPKVDRLLHLAARTDVDGCEQERARGESSDSWIVNVEATRQLARLCADQVVPMTYVSTDFVFSAEAPGPFVETDPPAKTAAETSWYGWTKLNGERAALAAADANSVLRIAFPYRARFRGKLDLARRIVQAHDAGEKLPLFVDQQFTPTFTDDVAEAVERIAAAGTTGILHCAPTDRLSPFDFGRLLLQLTRRDPAWLRPGSFEEFRRLNATPRPKSGGLALDRSRRAGLPARTVRDGLARFASQIAASG